MEVETESVKLTLNSELTQTAHRLSMEAHEQNQPYITNTKKHGIASSSSSSSSSMEVSIFAFPGSWDVKDWYHDEYFGETDVDRTLFPSMLRVGENLIAKVNAAFLQRFKDLLNSPSFKTEVMKAVKENKKILFTGHSSGGAIASLSTLWMLDEYFKKQKNRFPIGCVTFGSPLIGDRTLSHAVRREKWAGHFTHFVMEHDIVPRIMLAPKTSIQEQLPIILKSFQETVNPTKHKSRKLNIFDKSKQGRTNDQDPIDANRAVEFFENVVISASTVASHVAFNLMEPTNSLMEKLSVDFVKVSPYRPSGFYVFCTSPHQHFLVENPNAVLQLLFYFLQLTHENQNLADFALNCISESFSYEKELKNELDLEKLVNLKKLNDDLLTPNGTAGDLVRTSNKALFDLSVDARCCLMAAEEAENKKIENEKAINTSMRKYASKETKKKKNRDELKIIEDMLDEARKYKENHAGFGNNYYDAFKLQNNHADFSVNVDRLKLAKIFDEVVEMVKSERDDLPDEFEGREEWVKVGTAFRRLFEPLDIGNYYRHSKGSGYMDVRPKRYKFTQRWYEHANGTGFVKISESNFVAELEEIKKEIEETKKKTNEENKKELESVEERVRNWYSDKNLREDADVFWGESLRSMLLEKHL